MIKNLWNESIDSPVFGHCVGLNEDQFNDLVNLIGINPVAAFGILNRILNNIEFNGRRVRCLKLDSIECKPDSD